ncbi:MAG: chitobiase/beta-hexosaminidase C-terminal domain-containing protein [Treponema sp.]|jgi:hypothetical protein|nr:chitobiase/beta-hexosaminidase C-terminal domain-containing protein [Treponema sp.]
MKNTQVFTGGLLFFVFILAGCVGPTGYYGSLAGLPITTSVSLAVASPVPSPGTGAYTKALSVTLTCATGGTDIYYTIDGSDPIAGSSRIRYSSAVSITNTTILKAIAVKEGVGESAIIIAIYDINTP